jgi:toxin ParE1/3/4
MVKLIWTDLAIDDLQNIADYIGESSERYAKLTVATLLERTDILKQFPQAGRIVPEKNEENVRELIEGSYRIIYEIYPDNIVYILPVVHSARDFKL